MSEELSESFGCILFFQAVGFFVLICMILRLRTIIKEESKRISSSLSALHKKVNKEPSA